MRQDKVEQTANSALDSAGDLSSLLRPARPLLTPSPFHFRGWEASERFVAANAASTAGPEDAMGGPARPGM